MKIDFEDPNNKGRRNAIEFELLINNDLFELAPDYPNLKLDKL